MAKVSLGGIGERIKSSAIARKIQENTQPPEGGMRSLERKLEEAYAEIGRQAAAQDGLERFEAVGEKARAIQEDIAALREQMAREAAESAARAHRVCPDCARPNPAGTKFCQECGRALIQRQASRCPACGQSYDGHYNFCGECGTRLEPADTEA